MMSTTHNMKRIVVGALLSGVVAPAGLGLSMGTAHAVNPHRTGWACRHPLSSRIG
jgi:hypothetical protein